MLRSCRLGLLAAGVLLAGFAGAARGQDPAKVDPKIYKSLFENDQVRVCEITFKPGAKIAMHAHPDHFVYVTSAGKLKLTHPDGSTADMDGKVGDHFWLTAESHAAENVGPTEFNAVVIEIRDAAGKSGKTAPVGDDAAKAGAAVTKVLVDNERIRVLDVTLKAGEKLPMHAHPCNVIYALTGGKAKYTFPDGKSTEKEMKKGQVIWSDPIVHGVENIGTNDTHVIHIEIKEAAKPAAKSEVKGG